MARKNNIGRRPSGTPSTGRRNAASGTTNAQQGDDTLVDLVEVSEGGINFFERNKSIILGVIVGAILLVAGYLIYQTFVKIPAEQDAAAAMAPAERLFEQDSFTLALSNPGPNALGFLAIIDEYGGTRAGNLANYYAAVSYLNLGQYEAALDYAKSFDADGDLLPAMKYGVMGDAYSELDDLDAAAEHYEKAVDVSGDNFLTGGYYLSKLGQLYQFQGKNAEALEAFRRLKSEYGQSPEALDADKYITMLEMAG